MRTLNTTNVDKASVNAPKVHDPRAVRSAVNGAVVAVWGGK